MKLNELTLKDAVKRVKNHDVTLKEIYTDIYRAISEKNPQLNIYLSVDKKCLSSAEKMSDLPLAGLPIAVKDNFLTVKLPTTASAKVLEGFMPPYESTVTQRLQSAGGAVIGKTNMDAWAHGSSTETSDWGPTKNPRNPKYLPGGSSGGSAASIVANACIAALGSETAGSIRQPASWCGCVGLKPTYGRVSRAGVVAMGSSLDSPGPMGKTVYDCALLLNQIAGYDKYDGTTARIPVPDFTSGLNRGVRGMKIGIVYMDHPNIRGSVLDLAIQKAAKFFESNGARVETVPLSQQSEDDKILTPDYAIGVYTVVQRAEVSSNLARYDGIRYGHDRSYFSAEAKRRIMLGTFTLSKGYSDKYYVRAQQVRNLYVRNFTQLFTKYDLLISSPTPGFALPLGATAGDPMFGELQDLLVEPSSLAGLPGISLPCYRDPKTNLFLGLNIMADYWQEEKMLKAANLYEQNHPEWNEWIKNQSA